MNDASPSSSRLPGATTTRSPAAHTLLSPLGAPKASANLATALDVLRRSLLLFVPLALIATAVLFLLYRAQIEASRSIIQANERNTVAIGAGVASARLAEVVSDLAYLPAQWLIKQWLQGGSATTSSALAGNFVAFVKSKTLYDKIRLIDVAGNEVIRVDWNGGTPRIAPEEELQNKADRYYVRETLRLDPKQILISPLDLNVEHGLIEQPLKPTIRFSLPVFDASGHKRGLVVVNYLAQHLLDRFAAISAGNLGETWLLNTDGYWLLGTSREDEWGFVFPARRDRTFAHAYPAAWKAILQGGDTGQFTADGALYTFEKLALSDLPRLGLTTGFTAPNAPRWILVTFVSTKKLDELQPTVTRNLALTGVTLILLLAAISFLVGRHWTARNAFEHAVRRSETLFRSLLEAAPDAVVIIERDGRILLTNAELERLFGYARAELVGQSVDMLVPKRYRQAHAEHRQSYVASPRTRPMGNGAALSGRRCDGSEFPIAASLSPIETNDGFMIFCDIRDITEQKRIERKIQDLNERLLRDNAALEAVNKELEAFSYSVSHDLRAPLRAIDGFAQALAEDYADRLDETGCDQLSRVRNAAQRMGAIIDDLLNLARVTRSELNTQDVDLSALVEEFENVLRQNEPARQVEFIIAPHINVRGDAGLLRRVVVNLVANAWKFTKDRSPAHIEFGQETRNGEAVYFVRDNGVGFDMAYADKLFGAFQRLHDAAAFPGTGIGLAIVQRIIHKHGGRLWASAEPDNGAAFYFTISVKEDDDD